MNIFITQIYLLMIYKFRLIYKNNPSIIIRFQMAFSKLPRILINDELAKPGLPGPCDYDPKHSEKRTPGTEM